MSNFDIAQVKYLGHYLDKRIIQYRLNLKSRISLFNKTQSNLSYWFLFCEMFGDKNAYKYRGQATN